MTVELVTRSAAETRALGAAVARILRAGDVVALHGDLGAGKTTFVQGALHALGVTGPVTSPTFAIVAEYPGPVPIAHVDAYRVAGAAELDQLGIEETFEGRIAFVEWPDRVDAALPTTRLTVHLAAGAAPEERAVRIAVTGAGDPGAPRGSDLAARAARLADAAVSPPSPTPAADPDPGATRSGPEPDAPA